MSATRDEGGAPGDREARGDEPRPHHDAESFVAAERAHRLEKLEALRRSGMEPYPVKFDPDRTLAEIRERFGHLGPEQETSERVRVAGRIMLIRRHGGLVFADLKQEGHTLQLLVTRDDVGEDAHVAFEHLDLGDQIGIEGTVMTTRRGELSIRVTTWRLLAKSLRALPEKHRGLADVDTRYRQRYLDLITNDDARRIFDVRSSVIAATRRVLLERRFTEVETPVLDATAGGAAARPFTTHHNALDIDLYLRIALELYLKRLIVGGFDRVFEIGRVFRNEGLDPRHNPEFTLLEAYQAYADYHDMMDLVEAIVDGSAQDAIGTTVVQLAGRDVDLKPPWRRVTMAELIREHAGAEMHPAMPLEEARAICDGHGIPYEDEWGSGRLMSEVYDAKCEPTLIEPTFVLDYPREVSPLARAHRDDPALVERFELVVEGRELANAYSELNDPVDQRERFEVQAALKAAGDEEAEQIDEDYVRALEYGMPPTGGLGVGMDRLVMILSGATSIREVILFPTMRPEDGARHGPAAASGSLPAPESLGAPSPAESMAEAEEPSSGTQATALTAPAASPRAGGTAARAADASVPRLLGAVVAVVGLLFLMPLVPILHSRLGPFDDPLVTHPTRVASHVAAVLAGLALLLVARELARRKRNAWRVAVMAAAVAAVVAVLKGPHVVAALVAGAVVVALVWWRDSFRAPPDPRSLFVLARFVPLYLAGVLVFGVIALVTQAKAVRPGLSAGGVLETVFGGLVGLDGPYTYEHSVFAGFFPDALLALGVAGATAVLLLALRSIAGAGGPSAADRDLARELVRSYGSDTLSYFALRRDRSYFFSSDRRAMIAYSYIAGHALAAGDPIGAPASIPRVVDEFLAFCRDRAWRVAFLAVREADLELYRDRGLTAVYLGDEAIVPSDRFTLEGGAMKPVREAVGRVERGHRFELVRESELPPAVVRQLNAISQRWRGSETERGYTMALGEDVEGREPDFLVAIARDGDDRPAGFLRLVPCYGDDPGYSLDLMRRLPDSVNGLTEFLVAKTAIALGERGFRRLSMNFAAWGRLFEEGRTLSLRERMLKRVAEVLNPYFQIRSLHDFNAKFGVDWLPRAIVMENPAAAPRVGLLYASAEGLVRLPLVGRYLVPRVAESAA